MALKVAVRESLVYLADDFKGLKVFDISIPSQINQIGIYETGLMINGIASSDRYAYLISQYGDLSVVDIDYPSHPRQVGSWKSDGIPPGYLSDVETAGNFLYISCVYRDLKILNVADPTNPVEINSLNISPLEIELSGNTAFVTTMDYPGKLLSLDISDPANPVKMDSLEIDYYSLSMKQMGNQLYILGTNTIGGTLRCIDVSNPSQLYQISKISLNHFQEMAAANGYLYIDLGGYLGIFDVSNPAMPNLIASFKRADVIADIQVSDRYCYLATISGLEVLDITVKNNPIQVSYLKTAGNPSCLDLLTEYILMGEIYDGLYIFLRDSIVALPHESSHSSSSATFDLQVYPNPFNSNIKITYKLPGTGLVTVTVYNSLGQLVTLLVDRKEEPGTHSIQWKAHEEASGIYLIKAEINNTVIIKKCFLIK